MWKISCCIFNRFSNVNLHDVVSCLIKKIFSSKPRVIVVAAIVSQYSVLLWTRNYYYSEWRRRRRRIILKSKTIYQDKNDTLDFYHMRDSKIHKHIDGFYLIMRAILKQLLAWGAFIRELYWYVATDLWQSIELFFINRKIQKVMFHRQ